MAGGGNSQTDFKDKRSVVLDTLLAFASMDWTFSKKALDKTENKLAS